MRIREIGLAALVGFAVIALLGPAPAQSRISEDRKPDRVCGLEPGEGAYNYVKVWDTDCRTANKVSRRAFKRFCGEEFQDCMPMPGDVIEGRVSAKGWKCEVKVGYEFGRAECRRDGARFIREYGS